VTMLPAEFPPMFNFVMGNPGANILSIVLPTATSPPETGKWFLFFVRVPGAAGIRDLETFIKRLQKPQGKESLNALKKPDEPM
jgi:hypothetical protein